MLGRELAIWKPGMLANQNTAFKLWSQLTIERITDTFGLDGESCA